MEWIYSNVVTNLYIKILKWRPVSLYTKFLQIEKNVEQREKTHTFLCYIYYIYIYIYINAALHLWPEAIIVAKPIYGTTQTQKTFVECFSQKWADFGFNFFDAFTILRFGLHFVPEQIFLQHTYWYYDSKHPYIHALLL